MHRKSLLLAAVGLAAMLSATVAGAVDERENGARSPIPPPLLPAAVLGPVAPPTKPKPKPAGFTVEQVKNGSAVPLHSKPGGPVVARAPSRTEFGSPQTLTVAGRTGGWLAVINEDVRDG